MSRRFDTVIAVDWSARSKPSPAMPSRDAIWIGTAGAGGGEPVYLRTRRAAEDWLAERLGAELSRGRRVLVGFDFPFGYPRGLAARVTGRDSGLALWDHLARLVADGPDNANDRWAVAAGLNARLGGTGPFWGCPAGAARAGLSPRKADRSFAGLPEFRLTERTARGAKSCWQLAYAGSVGSQALLGIPVLHRLRDRFAPRAVAWPLDTGLAPPDAPIVLAEIYPSLLAAAVAASGDSIRDRAQVRLAAEAYAALDREGTLAPLFAPRLADRDRGIVVEEEAWILGCDAAGRLRAALARPIAA